MKYLDRFISFIFALVILVISVTIILVLLGQVYVDTIFSVMHDYLFAEEAQQTALITSVIVALAALKVTIFNSSFKQNDKSPIIVETKHGMVEISQDTIENTVKSVASDFSEIKEVQAKMTKKQNGIKIFSSISVLANTNIRNLTAEFQEKIEQVIDETTGIKILSTDVKVKNIYDKNKNASNAENKTVIKENITKNEISHEVVNNEEKQEIAKETEEAVVETESNSEDSSELKE